MLTPNLIAPEIRQPLGRLRDAIRRFLTVDVLLSVLTFVVCYFWASLAVDYLLFRLTGWDWVHDAPQAIRRIALYGVVAALFYYVIKYWLVPYFKPLNEDVLALAVEHKFGERLHDRLITAVELADVENAKKYGYSEALIRQTVDEARKEIDSIHMDEVINFRRLAVKKRVLLGLALGVFLLVGLACMLIARIGPARFAGKFYDTASIWYERNILLKHTPWPRSVHLEMIGFPGNELRIGRDNASPRVRAAAYKWVYADDKTVDGWRPLNWADLKGLFEPGEIPELPIASLKASRNIAEVGSFLFSPAAYALQPPLPPELADVPSDPAKWQIDRVEQLFLENPEAKSYFRKTLDADNLLKLEGLFAKLDEKAGQFANTRKLRKLHIPADVQLEYGGLKSSVEMNMRKEAGGDFAGIMGDLKESVDFRLRSEDFNSNWRRITLVPPPALVELKRTELQPAYLFHTPPYDAARTPLLVDPIKIKGLKQEYRDQLVSLIGDRSKFDIPAGTEVILTAVLDKKLSSASLLPKPGKYPNLESDAEAKPIPLGLNEDGKSVTVTFSGADAITRPTEFELEFRDDDNVASRRAIAINPIDDRAPEVEVVVDVIRKVGSQYMCTAKAIVPFSKDGKVRDDRGLAKVEFTFTYYELESSVVAGTRAAFAMPLFLDTPLMPGIGDGVMKIVALREYVPLTRARVQSTAEANELVPAFVEDFNSRAKKLSLENLLPLLKKAPPSADDSPIVKSFEFKPADETGWFDLRKYARDLEERDPERNAQKSYQLTLNITATDTNVETGPKTAVNKEPFIFKVVSEAELLSEISREEGSLGLKLDEVIRRLDDMIAKFSGVASRSAILKERDDFLPEQTQAGTLSETLAKGKDITGEISSAYTRILKEYKFNRFQEGLISKLESKIVTPLEEVVAKEFPEAEEAFNGFSSALQEFRPAPPEQVQLTRQKLDALAQKLRRIRDEMGGITGIQQAIILLQKVLEGQDKEIKKRLEDMLKKGQEKLYQLALAAPSEITIAANQKQTVKIGVQIPPLFIGEPSLKVEAPSDSELKVPGTVKFSDEAADVPIEIQAGAKKGEFKVTVTPVTGKAVTIKVNVK